MTSSSLYKYVGITGLKKILEGFIRFTQPSAFNDPFELLPEIVIPIDEPEKPLSISFNIMAKRRQPLPGELKDVPVGCRSNDVMSRDIVQQLNNLIGILCLSRVNDSLLMWAHYADQYGGAVVEFDGSNEFFNGQVDVEYLSRRPMRHVSVYQSPHEPIPVAELCAKSEQWKYEKEVRIIRSLSDCEKTGKDSREFSVYVKKISYDCIKSVILGERTAVPIQREIYERLKDTKISLSLAAIDHNEYAFRQELIKMNAPESESMPWISPRTAHIFSDRKTPFGDIARDLIENHPMSKAVNKSV